MRKMTVVCFLVPFTLAIGHRTFAQDAQQAAKTQNAAQAPEHYYHLDFVVEELGPDGKPVNSRTYSTTISTEAHSMMSIRTGSRVPVSTGPNQFQYQDVGVDFDVHNGHEIGRELAFDLTASVSGVVESNDGNVRQPVIRSDRWQASVLIPVGKPTVVITSDSVDSKGSTRVLVTATPIQ